MPKDLLLEIGTEPLPARFVAPALEQLLKNSEVLFKESRLGYLGARAFATHRRLAILFLGVEEKSSPLDKVVQGPPARMLKDEKGGYTPQAEGFARKQGLSPEALETVSTPKGEFLLARLSIPGEPAAKILARLLPELVSSLEFAKTMEWEESHFRFGRPLRTLTALFGKTVIPFQLAGVKSGRQVWGLPAQAKKPAALAEASGYPLALKNLSILVDPAERREVLVKRLNEAASHAGGRLDLDEDLLEETVFMTEHPVPVAGRFRKEFLELPGQLLSMVLKKQLKFFPLLSKQGLMPAFVGVRDGVSEGQALVREGYERVLEARLSDAAFFFKRDKAAPLESKLPLLERVTYQKKLGSLSQKASRVAQLSAWLCEALRQESPVREDSAAMIARLAYADLVTEVVKEFPELQGAMGGVYARHDGLDERVALGLEQFYYPVAAKSPIPATPEGAVVSLAGKLDSLAGNFAVGNVPTGSADPFALRRQAVGLLRILIERQLAVDLEDILRKALGIQDVGWEPGQLAKTAAELSDFIWGRAESLFQDMGYRIDEIRSVRPGALQNLPKTVMRLAAIHKVRENPDFELLAAAFKRAANILKQARVDAEDCVTLDRGVLREEAEVAFYDALTGIEGRAREKFYQGNFEEGLKALVAIKPHLDLFFEKVMVMAEDPALRRQRLALLAKLVGIFNAAADLSELQAAS